MRCGDVGRAVCLEEAEDPAGLALPLARRLAADGADGWRACACVILFERRQSGHEPLDDVILDHRIIFLKPVHPMLDIAAESVLRTRALTILDRELHDARVSLHFRVSGEIKRLDPRDETNDPADAWLGAHPRHKDRGVPEEIHQDLLAFIIEVVAGDDKGRTEGPRVLVDETPPQDAASRARGHIKAVALERCLQITE